jgi:hypothetical protein
MNGILGNALVELRPILPNRKSSICNRSTVAVSAILMKWLQFPLPVARNVKLNLLPNTGKDTYKWNGIRKKRKKNATRHKKLYGWMSCSITSSENLIMLHITRPLHPRNKFQKAVFWIWLAEHTCSHWVPPKGSASFPHAVPFQMQKPDFDILFRIE